MDSPTYKWQNEWLNKSVKGVNDQVGKDEWMNKSVKGVNDQVGKDEWMNISIKGMYLLMEQPIQ